MRRTPALLGALALVVVSTACGDESDPSGPSGTAALTSRAIAAVMLDHLPDDTTHRQATPVDEYSPKGLVGAELSYHGDGEYDGDSVEVTVQPGRLGPCDRGDHCTELGDDVRLTWGEMIPEEDPGGVGLSRQNGDEVVHLGYAGPSITGDPRELDLEFPVELLAELVSDPRLRLETDPSTVAAGEQVDDWSGGEVDPSALELVPHTDATIVVGWIDAYGHDDEWRYLGPSPVKDVLGPDAVGGRVEVRGYLRIGQMRYVDALAAPRPPAWLARGRCLEGYRCGRFQGVQVVYRPAVGDDPGDVYLVHRHRSGETVAIHSVGNRIPDDVSDAAWAGGLGMWGYDLTEPTEEIKVSLRTTRQKLRRAEKLLDR